MGLHILYGCLVNGKLFQFFNLDIDDANIE